MPQPMMYSPAAYAPQGSGTGASFAPTGSTPFGNVPLRIGDSPMTDDGRRDVLDDMRDAYREAKTTETSRTASRKSLKDQAKEKYVEVIGGDVQAPEDLKDSENKEIDQIVDIVMREDSATNSASPSGYPNQYQYPYANQYPYGGGYPTQYPYGGGYPPQPMFYYYVYPIAPVAQPHHQHHLFHRY